MELFNRKTTLLEIVHGRIPHQAEKFFENPKASDKFQKLLNFVSNKIALLRTIQLPFQKTQTVKVNATEAREAKNVQYGPNTFAQQVKTSPKKDQPEMGRCLYCQSSHQITQCNRVIAMSLAERVEMANKLRLCFHCMETGHGAKFCPEKRNVTCTTCNRRGHIALFHGRQQLPPSGASEEARRNRNNNVGFETTIINPEEKTVVDAASGGKSKEAEDTESPSI